VRCCDSHRHASISTEAKSCRALPRKRTTSANIWRQATRLTPKSGAKLWLTRKTWFLYMMLFLRCVTKLMEDSHKSQNSEPPKIWTKRSRQLFTRRQKLMSKSFLKCVSSFQEFLTRSSSESATQTMIWLTQSLLKILTSRSLRMEKLCCACVTLLKKEILNTFHPTNLLKHWVHTAFVKEFPHQLE